MTSLHELHFGDWRRFPKHFEAHLSHPRFGVGTAFAAYWTFADLVPCLKREVQNNGGKLELEGWTIRFGNPPMFIHKIRYEARR
ncbi:MAG TPA: hypothetical protein VJ249_03775 [Candidatus Bathyarchaeia archaeon]|nr:hypothetical protein [Candidatus Bathyarchaeia archaeon]